MSTGATILLVDDEQVLLDYVGLALQMEDYRVLTAHDGIQALELLQSQAADLILADIAMPKMNGYQLYEKVCQNPEWVSIPFIFLTARAMDSDIRFGKELGVDDYLTKPIQPEDLLAAVRGKLRHVRQVKDAASQDQSLPVTDGCILAVGRLRIDSAQHRVWLEGQGHGELQLSVKEFALLKHLVLQAGGVVSPQALVKTTHDYDTDSIDAGRLIRPMILSLRRKLNLAEGEIGSIMNVRGVGYRVIISE